MIKRIRLSIYDLFNNYPDEFGRFIMALDALKKSEDWLRICGIHGLTFDPSDSEILCPIDPHIVSQITGINEPQYCPHGVTQFLIWHTIYILEFEFLLNKYNHSINKNFINLPYFDFSGMGNDNYSFLSEEMIKIKFDNKDYYIKNPLINGKIYLNNELTITTRNGFLNKKSRLQKNIFNEIKNNLDDSFNIGNYESISSVNIPKTRKTITQVVPLETPHNLIHTLIGGTGGSMSDITTAAHDPVFWLHHCNIDRYFYNWLSIVSNNFTNITNNIILSETMELNLVPFFRLEKNLFNNDFNSHKYAWQNNTNTFLKVKHVFNLSQFNYTYPKIDLKEKLSWHPQYIELIGVPIPLESCDIKLYIVPKKINFYNLELNTKSTFLAGLSSWFGINRSQYFCSRCEITKTNIIINITEYLLENNINKKNINNYNLILEGYGLKIIDNNGKYIIYDHDKIIGNGKLVVILDDDDIIKNSKFKFEKKYIHTKLIKSIINKLNNFGYIINDKNNWDEIIEAKNKFEKDWNLDLIQLINMKNLHGNNLISQNKENKINYLKNKIIDSKNNNKELILNYITIGFNIDLKIKLKNSISQWINLLNSKSINIKFNEINYKKYLNKTEKIDIQFTFISINNESNICGYTYLVNNLINIDINSNENFNIKGLFELIVLHELGHAFGLIHDSNPNSIMYPFITNSNKNICDQDVENIFI